MSTTSAALAWRRAGLVLGPLLALAVALVPGPLHALDGYGARPAYAAAVALLMAVWWFTEALPIAWTALLPLLLFPLLGVFEGDAATRVRAAAEPYADAYIFLFLGGMTIGAALEAWNLHRRIALHVMRAIGTGPSRLLFGMLAATALVSMWISNTATAVMMLPIAVALVAQLEAQAGRALPRLGAALVLAVAYGANVGGIGTKIGTGTNSIFAGFAADTLGRDVSFLEYLVVGGPFVLLFLPVAWWVLRRHAGADGSGIDEGRAVLDRELAALGPRSREENAVAAVFLVAAALWIAADPLRSVLAPIVQPVWPFGKFLGKHYEALVAMTAALVLVAMRLATWQALRRVPWGTLVLLGGSFALAAGIEGSGLGAFLAARLAALATYPPLVQTLVVAGSSVALSAVASNTATINVLLNVLPRSLPLLATATLASSCDFALPAGTPPNAIVFGSGRVRFATMMRVGIVLDALAVALLALYGRWWIPRVLG